MKNITARKIVLFSIGLLSAIMLLVGLSFSVIYCNMSKEIMAEIGSSYKLYESGFDMLSFEFSAVIRTFFISITQDKPWIELYELFFGIASLLTLVFSIVSLGLIILAFFSFNQKKGEKTLKALLTFSIIISAIYTIFPIIFSISMNIDMKKMLEAAGEYYENINFKIKTAAFLPLIIQILLTIAYAVCSKKIISEKVIVKEVSEEKSSVVKEKQIAIKEISQKTQFDVEEVLSFEHSVIELLKEYKKLHDENIVTDAEYMEKRVKIMNSANEKEKRLSSILSKVSFEDVVKAEKTVVNVLREYKKLAENQIISDADYISKKVVLLSCVIN